MNNIVYEYSHAATLYAATPRQPKAELAEMLIRWRKHYNKYYECH